MKMTLLQRKKDSNINTFLYYTCIKNASNNIYTIFYNIKHTLLLFCYTIAAIVYFSSYCYRANSVDISKKI